MILVQGEMVISLFTLDKYKNVPLHDTIIRFGKQYR